MTTSRITALLRCIAVLGIAIACNLAKATDANPTVISVRIHDDRGSMVDRIQVDVTQSNKVRLSLQTTNDGTADFVVTNVGVYEVSVVPRAGYQSGADPLVRDVWVVGNARIVLDFTLQRALSGP